MMLKLIFFFPICDAKNNMAPWVQITITEDLWGHFVG